jgi:hypothetical protein
MHHDGIAMRTTLDIEDDVLAAAKELARRQRVSAGQVISRLVREALLGRDGGVPASEREGPGVGGFRPFPASGSVITDEQVNALRDAEGL